jgi:2-dehydro-3-deoxyphosphooctonate aldolase (KDO 8-P synthase)
VRHIATLQFEIAPGIKIGGGEPPVFIAGPCVIEGEEMLLRHAEYLVELTGRIGVPFIFKSSYDKANRSSGRSYRGPGLKEGLRMLAKVKREFGCALLTDAHSIPEIEAAGQVVDVIQIPAFLCRQTDMLVTAARTGKVVNIKKGQWVAPDEVNFMADKVVTAGGERVMITERGTSFGYHRLVVDYAGIVSMRETGWPVVFDATHSVQRPGSENGKSGGDRRMAPYLAWAAAAVGVDGLFIETHEDPDRALSDGPNMIPLASLEPALKRFLTIASES